MSLKLTTLAAAALASMATAEDEKTYARMEEVISTYGFTWEAKEVTTGDGYILTMFHVTGNDQGLFTPDKPPVFIQHGAGDDACHHGIRDP